MRSMQVVRGNLAADPVFFPPSPDEQGELMAARYAITVMENRRVRDADGAWKDDPRGPLAVSVNAYGGTATVLARCDLHRGDPVIAVGEQVRAEGYLTRDGHPAAKISLTAVAVCFDTVMLRRKEERGQSRQEPAPADVDADPGER